MKKSNPEFKTDVIICGAGPSGLMMAAQLAAQGISFRIFDSNKPRTMGSGALFLHARTMEIFHQLGLAHNLLNEGIIAHEIDFIFEHSKFATLPIHDFGKGLSRYPYVMLLEQSKTEQYLLDYIQGFGIAVAWNTTLETLENTMTGVRVVVKLENAHEEMNCSWFVGADGGRSMSRQLLEIPVAEKKRSDSLFLLDFKTTRKLDEKDLFPWFLFFDVWMFFYYLFFDAALFKKPRAQWK